MLVYYLGGARGVIRRRSRVPRVVLYHSCAPAEGAYVEGLRSNTPPEKFKEHLEFFLKHYRPVSLSEALAPNRPAAALAVTFDDGYRSVFEYAYPLLRERRMPATVYLISGAIGFGSMVWVNALNCLVRQGMGERAALELGWKPLPVTALVDRVIAELTPPQIASLLATLTTNSGTTLCEMGSEAELFLTRSQIDEMARNRITFGNHTVSHPNLALCRPQESRRQVVEADKTLRQLPGFTSSLAFPFGQTCEVARQAAIALGYDSIVEVGGTNSSASALSVARQPVSDQSVAELFADMEIVEPMKAWFRSRFPGRF